ncbi:bifunctional riboflavin kinase/FAD synthetase [Thermoflavifilum thermophilum]|uniref:Riboflavin biosynthesis protein n=1 Tax=Thermoflavifilum thermophilum TaxID=1393122 RepID=A0A1I7NHV5_9BACT|nr:bifunctional riboflavin kinase/FAD synthetase [Thermoflavifilum thermophilum]SFV34239.1 riboflavin kinase / FMN adenylyltransferase [Thermoflavifilum thermophilum]
MHVYRSPEELLAKGFAQTVITIGTFDGVHKGHQTILHQLKNKSLEKRLPGVVITFDPHPREVLHPEQPVQLLNTLEERIQLFEQQGIEHLVIVPFTKAFSELSAEAYVKKFLIHYFHPAVIIIGYDHHFGHDRKGDIHLLENLQQQYGYTLEEISPQVVQQVTISSTRIRQALVNGEIELANTLLGYNYSLAGTVARGDQIGRKLGYPTANLQLGDPRKLIPATGVYAATVQIDEKPIHLKGMLNIGYRPTFQGKELRIEIHIFDFSDNIYGHTMRIYLHAYLRPDQYFENAEALRRQMDQDKIMALQKLASFT